MRRGSLSRSLLGPLIVGLAAWCAAGTLTVASADAASPRLAVPAAWWIFPLAVIIALAVPGWRRRPMCAWPAVLSTLPWWPIPLPPIALIWTGPLAWLPIALAVGCAVGAEPLRFAARLVGAPDARRSTIAAGLLTLVAAVASAWTVHARLPGGDEPHYLMVTQSLLKDGDLRIENNHRQRDYAGFFPGDISPHFVTRGRDGEIYSIHAPGLPVLVLPAFAAFGYRGAQALLILLAALTGSLVWRIGWRATGDPRAAWFGWAAIVGSATFLLHSFTIFPDGPGASIVAAATLIVLELRTSSSNVGVGRLMLAGGMLGALPWLHTRFAVLAGGFGCAFTWLILTDVSRSTAGRIARFAAFAIPPLASAIGWFGFFQIVYGTFSPTAPYGATAGTRASYIPGGLLGLLFDQQFGLLIYTPVLIAAAAGLARIADSATRWTARVVAAIALAYLAGVATYWLWWAGSPASPARFALAAVPVLAIPLALSWQTADASRRQMLLALLTLSLTITSVLVVVGRGSLGWNMRNGEAVWLDWLSPVANLPRGWPSFFWRLDPGRLESEWPFVVHVAAWLAAFAGVWLAAARLVRPKSWSAESSRLAVAAWLMAGVTIATQAGWWLNGSNGLDPARSQMAVISGPGSLLQIGSLGVRRVPSAAGAVRVRSEEPGRLDGPGPWLSLENVPAGRYVLHVVSSRPRAGQLLVTVGRGGHTIRALRLEPLSRQTAILTLPAGALELTIDPNRDLENIAGQIELEPMELATERRFARAAVPYQTATAFFLDDHADVEPEGFWVHGGASAGLVLEAASAAAPIPLTIRNGGSRNSVAIRAEGIERTESLAPFETRTIELSAAETGTLHLTIASPSGFRPSDDGKSRDDRYLGVFVAIK